MIDLDSGAVSFDDHLTIDAKTSLTRVEEIPGTKISHSVPGRIQLNIGIHSLRGESWGVGAVFSQSNLSQVWLQCLSADGVNATVWSLENEKIRKAIHDAMLTKLCSSSGTADRSISSLEYKFPWGKISSILDIRGVQALILIEYS